MARFDPDSAECLVFSYKEGLLSSMAHDLKIRVTRFSIEVDDATHEITATFDAGSLEVVSAMRDGREDAKLSDGDKRDIESNIRKDVLRSSRHPEVRFRSTRAERKAGDWEIEGELTLNGTRRSIRTTATVQGDDLVAEVLLHQPDFGIKPYRAALGALRVQAEVKVRLSVPVADL